MLFFNSYKGKIQINKSINIKELFRQIAIMLEQKKAQDVFLRNNVISFKGPTIFLIYLGNPLYHFSKGNFCVKTIKNKITVVFEVSFKSYLVYFNIFSFICLSFAIYLLPTEPALSIITKTGYILLFATIAFGITHFIPILIFYLMIKKLKRKS